MVAALDVEYVHFYIGIVIEAFIVCSVLFFRWPFLKKARTLRASCAGLASGLRGLARVVPQGVGLRGLASEFTFIL